MNSSSDSEFQTVVLGGLLHDVGKLLQRGDSFGGIDIKGRHPKVSADFVSAFSGLFSHVTDADLLKTIVQRHHEDQRNFPLELLVQGLPAGSRERNLASLVSFADNLSSAERGERVEQYQDFRFVPLAPALGRLRSPEEEVRPDPADERLRAAFLAQPGEESFERLQPAILREYPAGEMNRLILAFGDAFRAWASAVPSTLTFDLFVDSLLSILFAYASTIPSNTQEEYPDVSLYDHLKTTAAIAAALYRYHAAFGDVDESAAARSEAARFLLVGGDLTGIQSYIFSVATVGAGGAAQRLRARSFYLQLLSESAARAVLATLGVPATNLLISAGGRFYVLGPNLPAAVEELQKASSALQTWLVTNLNAAVGLNLAWESFPDEAFRARGQTGFGGVLARVNERLAEAKARPLADALRDGGRWREDAFVLSAPPAASESCPACTVATAPSGEEVCAQCKRDRDLGRRLPRAKAAVFGERGVPAFQDRIEVSEAAPRPGTRAMVLNDPPTAARGGYAWRYVANHVPTSETGDVLTFDTLAEQAQGRPYLGFLKADVDKLGQLVSFGLKRPDNAHLDTISRVVGVSRALETFFAGWVEHLLRSDFPDCYAVFSGGDDLFVVGPWDRTLDLATRVREDFRRYTAGNPALTLSAAVAIVPRHEPIASVSHLVEVDLEKAKDAGRDRFTVFGRPIAWKDWGLVREKWRDLLASGEMARASSAFLYSLREYGRMWERYRDRKDTRELRFHPMLAYDAARNLRPQETPRLAALVEELLAVRPLDEQQRSLLDHLAVLAQLLLYSRKGERL